MPTDRIGNLDTGRIAKIMTAALEEFAAHSYQHSSYNRIIKRCGISKGTMYYYFKSKEDLFLTLLNATIEEFSHFSLPRNPPENQDIFWKQTHVLISHLFKTMIEKPILGQFIQKFLTAESRKAANPATSTVFRIDDWLQDYLLTGQLVGAIRRDLPMELLTNVSWNQWETFCQWLRECELELTPEESANILTDLLRRTLELKNSSTATSDRDRPDL